MTVTRAAWRRGGHSVKLLLNASQTSLNKASLSAGKRGSFCLCYTFLLQVISAVVGTSKKLAAQSRHRPCQISIQTWEVVQSLLPKMRAPNSTSAYHVLKSSTFPFPVGQDPENLSLDFRDWCLGCGSCPPATTQLCCSNCPQLRSASSRCELIVF